MGNVDKRKILDSMVKLTYDLNDSFLSNHIDNLGPILHENWMLKKSITHRITDNLIDELYDRSVKVIMSAHVPLLDLYVSGRLRFEMDRCQSRLLEMQSTEYLERPHRPV